MARVARAADSECARLKVHSDAQLDVCAGLTNAFQHLREVVNADAYKPPEVREEAAAFFKRMGDEEEEGLTIWRVWCELSMEAEYTRLNVHFVAQLDVYTVLLDAL